jgi:hypothetical protein
MMQSRIALPSMRIADLDDTGTSPGYLTTTNLRGARAVAALAPPLKLDC